MIVTFETVTTWPQAQELRTLRNQCREQMTRDTAEITLEQQARFYEDAILSGKVTAVLLRRESLAVAYGLLWPGAGELWLSCGVAAGARGEGLGAAIVRMMTEMGRDRGLPVRLEVWQDNQSARAVYEKAGYAWVGTDMRDGRFLEVMEHA